MELKYIVMTIIKILISIPTILLFTHQEVYGASLMGGYLDNNQNFTTINISDSSVWNTFQQNSTQSEEKPKPIKQNNLNSQVNEKMPDPSALVLPGYNLPENIFNKGKPFYLEKDPLTGKVDFNTQTFVENEEDYEYIDEVPNTNIYDKANIDRKDGSIGKYNSHKASDVNQLTPNFHDFLNLPVKYNPEKYVYPLISNSYANTKVQGNTNKYNHKSYGGAIYKPTANPTYSGEKTYESEFSRSTSQPQVTITTTQPTTTTQRVYLTTKPPNLMHGFENYANVPPKHKQNEIYLTTQNVNDIYLTTKGYAFTTTTKRPLSLFEQLFGEYDDITTTEAPKKVTSLFQNLPNNKNKNEPDDHKEVEQHYNPEVKNPPNILTGSDLAQENMYVYEDYESVPEETDNNSILQNQSKFEVKQTSTSPPISYTITTSPTTTSTTTVRTTSTTTPTTTTSAATTTLSTTTSTTAKPSYYDESSTDYDLALSDNSEYDLEPAGNNFNAGQEQKIELTSDSSKVITSLPIGDNHIGSQGIRPPIIALTHNLKEQLNNEKVISPPYNHQPVQQAYSNQPVSQPYNHQPIIQTYNHQQVPSSNSIRISPNQDTVSFVVGQQQNVGTGYVGSSFQNQPFSHKLPFTTLDEQSNGYQKDTQPEPDTQSFINSFADMYKPYPNIPDIGGSSLSIQPIKTSEASLSIGVPLNNDKKIPGQVVDEKINDEIEFSNKGTGNKIVFPTEKISSSTYSPPGLVPPPPRQPIHPNREVLQLDSKPMYHQLPSDLTPPNEKELTATYDRPRPPWDPRPGHFYNGRPEYSRPPRPQAKPNGEIYKRVDNLPNILPQFRPNVKSQNPPPHYYDHMGSFKNGFMRQPLLERPSNRPIAYFEKLVPPPPPKNLHNLRKVPIIDNKLKHRNAIEDNSKNEQYEFYSPPHPPQVLLANRRKSDEPTIETLQMLQAKHIDTKDVTSKVSSNVFKSTPNAAKDNTEKPLYVVYPVNTAPIKLDVIDSGKKETVVVGTRAELPLPPSKINHEFSYESIIDRNDAPILKPHPKPSNLPVKSNFPYPLERPDITTLHSGNSLDSSIEDHKFPFNNQWNAYENTEARIVTGSKINYKNANQISVTLKTYTEKPIAVAYTPTEPYKKLENTEKYSMPNYASPVVSEVRPGFVDKSGSEITLSAVMHTHPQISDQNPQGSIENVKHPYLENHKIVDDEEENSPPKLGFQAPFQASVNIDGISQGWTVVKNEEKAANIDRSDQDVIETTTQSTSSTTKFDINNFKPQMLSGFKPIYSYSTEEDSAKASIK